MWQKIKVWFVRKYFRFISAHSWKGQLPESPSESMQIPTPAGAIPVRLYSSNARADKPLIAYFHGGGWVIGDLDTHHPYCLALSARSGCTVVAVGYRLAPGEAGDAITRGQPRSTTAHFPAHC